MPSSPPSIAPEDRADAELPSERWLYVRIVAVAVFAWLLIAADVNRERTWGWDESMHAELPAARIVELVYAGEGRGAIDVALACDRYPFVVPVFLAGVQLVTGISEDAARRALASVWCLGLVAAMLLVRRILCGRPWARAGAGFVGVLLVFTSLGRLFAPTLFLEAPFTALMTFTLLAWVRRGDPGRGRGADLLAGALFALTFFTKFNYGLLLGLGLALDGACEWLANARAGRSVAALRRFGWFALPFAVSSLWWFALPLPGGLELAARHREAFVSFLSGNQDFAPTPWSWRIVHWTFLAVPSIGLPFVVVGLASSLRLWREPAVRACWLVALALVVPISLHPFQLDRFLLPPSVPLMVVACAGVMLFQENERMRRFTWQAVTSVVVTVGACLGWQLWWSSHALSVLGLASSDPKVREYQQAQLDDLVMVSRHDALPTNGLLREEAAQLLGWAANEAGPTARVGWLGMSSELSPAAIHLGLLERGGSVERFLADAHREMDVTFEGVDPNWTKEQLAEFAAGFDVFFATDPPDLARRANRAFTAKYRRMLVDELGWSEAELGSVEIDKGLVRYPVRLFACRPPKR